MFNLMLQDREMERLTRNASVRCRCTGSWCRWIMSSVYALYYVYLARSLFLSTGFGGRAVFHLTFWIWKDPRGAFLLFFCCTFPVLSTLLFVRNGAQAAAFGTGRWKCRVFCMDGWLSGGTVFYKCRPSVSRGGNLSGVRTSSGRRA